ncbi:multimeric flavodoxin WrbA [Chitinophaga japonensis]|uniref:Multimeric flavodoxin WrbA n=2 Tax=Chitinophaga japonensis TaxID=104662 RepID=A0A562T975_CHIJA|nr:multimeric flavodoxin WrbA [Chitinophaga japonensis]
MAIISIVFHSGLGHTKVLAEKIQEGARSVNGNEVSLLEIKGEDVSNGQWKNETITGKLDASDAIIFGCPTYMGSASAVFKAFLESAFYPWLDQRWKEKVAAGFTNSASQSGDKLNTLVDLQVFASQMGMVWIPLGDLPTNNYSEGSIRTVNRLGSFMGVMAQSNADQSFDATPSDGDRLTALRFGAHVAKATQRWIGQAVYQTERHNEEQWKLLEKERIGEATIHSK